VKDVMCASKDRDVVGLLIQQACFTNTVNAIVLCALGVDKRNVFERDRHETVCRYRSVHVQHHGWE
jgi:hypothetical protein